MGVTAVDIEILEPLIKMYDPRGVIDLGAQNNYSQGGLPAPYMSDWWNAKRIDYYSIDMSGENNSINLDLSLDWEFKPDADFVMDFGTSEHVGKAGAFSWEAIYNCWKNKHDLLRIGGLMINENPKTGNWPDHGFNYYTLEFYSQLCKMSGYVIEGIQQIPAMSNIIDGWNILCILRKLSDKFPTLELFKRLDLRQK